MTVADSTQTRLIGNVIGGREAGAADGRTIEKRSPATGEVISHVARSGPADVEAAVAAARAVQPDWAARTVVERGLILRRIATLLERDRERIAAIVADETGKAPREAAGETDAAIEMGHFVAGEGRRWYARTTTSGVPNRQAMTIRQPVGVAGLIIAANTPIANVAWKVFPALLCGNGVVLKASEDTPQTALAFALLAAEAGVPAGVLNVVNGLGREAGQALVEHPDVDLVSFTGSTAVGRMVARLAGERLAKVCLELGGKNPLVVCDDADLEAAAKAAALSAFSNAGQRCAAGSRIIVFDAVYDRFRDLLAEHARAQRVGSGDEHDFGPVINERQLTGMLGALDAARARGAEVVAGGHRLDGPEHGGGYYMAPTLVEGAGLGDELARRELFGPIATLHRVSGFDEAVEAANASPYGLTAAIWTASVHRGQEFIRRVASGVASVNGPTYGSEPHMPFGGLGDSGSGWREAGTEAIEVYSELKTVYVNHDPRPGLAGLPDAVALIPARAGSVRVPGKNVRLLAGHPLLAYTIAAAWESGVFGAVVVSTDSEEIAAIARRYGADVPALRPSALAGATSPDIEWVQHALDALAAAGPLPEVFSILRPTSPFRRPETIRAAFERLVAHGDTADSLRAVRLCREHPGKMWIVDGETMRPLLTSPAGEVPMHSRQYQDLPVIHVQDSSLEMAWTRVALAGSIAGERVLAWECPGVESFSIDYPDDWEQAERLASGEGMLTAPREPA